MVYPTGPQSNNTVYNPQIEICGDNVAISNAEVKGDLTVHATNSVKIKQSSCEGTLSVNVVAPNIPNMAAISQILNTIRKQG